MQHEQATQHLSSLEERLRDYQIACVRFREMCKHLSEEKEELIQVKEKLEQEVHQLREELEAASFASHGSSSAVSQHSLSHSTKEKEKESQTVSALECVLTCM